MTKRPPPGKCVHCLKNCERLNWDHVFPVSWYPDTTEKDKEKWKIPSCIPCNNEYGVLEKDFLIRIGLCLDPNDPAASGVVEKALRSIDPTQAKNNKDRKHREKKRMQILSQMMPANEVPSSSIYPGFGPDKWPGEISTHAVTISRDARTKISEKIVRGLLFLEEGVLIDESYEIQTYTLTEEGAQPLIEAVNRWGVIHAQEPGIIVRRATVPEDQKSSLFEIEIWGQFKMYTIVHRKDA